MFLVLTYEDNITAFIYIINKRLKRRLIKSIWCKPHGSTFLNDAPLGVVVCAEPEKSDVWVEDASIATIFIELAATSLGLGSCWIQIRERMHYEAQTAEA